MRLKDNLQRVLFLILFSIVTLNAGDSFKMILKESDLTGKITYEEKYDLSLEKINNEVKHNKILKEIVLKILAYEKEYVDRELFFVKSIYDEKGNEWTISITVVDKDSSISQFICKQGDIIINGWINRNNRDIFGLKILNF